MWTATLPPTRSSSTFRRDAHLPPPSLTQTPPRSGFPALGRVGARSAAVTGNELSHSRNQVGWNLHNRLSPVFEGGFILRYRLGLRLLLVVSKNPADPLLVPA
jgi:hypothetical protein